MRINTSSAMPVQVSNNPAINAEEEFNLTIEEKDALTGERSRRLKPTRKASGNQEPLHIGHNYATMSCVTENHR